MEDWEKETIEKMKRNLPSVNWLPKCPCQPGLGHFSARYPDSYSCLPRKGSDTQTLELPTVVSKAELAQVPEIAEQTHLTQTHWNGMGAGAWTSESLTWVIFCHFPRHIAGKLDQKMSDMPWSGARTSYAIIIATQQKTLRKYFNIVMLIQNFTFLLFASLLLGEHVSSSRSNLVRLLENA